MLLKPCTKASTVKFSNIEVLWISWFAPQYSNSFYLLKIFDITRIGNRYIYFFISKDCKKCALGQNINIFVLKYIGIRYRFKKLCGKI